MPKVVAPSVASSAVHRCVASRVRIHPEQAPVYTKWSSPLFFYFSFFSLLFSSLFIFFVSFGSWSSLSEMYMYDTIHEKWKRMAKNTADLRDEIKRGRSLLNNLKSLFIFLFLSFSLFLSLSLSLSLFLSFILPSFLSETFLSLFLSCLSQAFRFFRIFGELSLVPAAGNSESTIESIEMFSELRSRSSILLISPVGNYSIYSSSDFLPFRSSSLASP